MALVSNIRVRAHDPVSNPWVPWKPRKVGDQWYVQRCLRTNELALELDGPFRGALEAERECAIRALAGQA